MSGEKSWERILAETEIRKSLLGKYSCIFL